MSVVRLAREKDEGALYDLLMALERDNNSFGIVPDPERILEHIQMGTRARGGFHGVIDSPDPEDPIKLAASIGIIFNRHWCAANYHLNILWLFVRPEYRKHRYDDALVDWARDKRDKMREVQSIDLVDSPFSRTRLKAKMRLWSRWGEQVGGIFVIR